MIVAKWCPTFNPLHLLKSTRITSTASINDPFTSQVPWQRENCFKTVSVQTHEQWISLVLFLNFWNKVYNFSCFTVRNYENEGKSYERLIETTFNGLKYHSHKRFLKFNKCTFFCKEDDEYDFCNHSCVYFMVGMATAACVCVTSVSRHNWVTVLVWV